MYITSKKKKLSCLQPTPLFFQNHIIPTNIYILPFNIQIIVLSIAQDHKIRDVTQLAYLIYNLQLRQHCFKLPLTIQFNHINNNHTYRIHP